MPRLTINLSETDFARAIVQGFTSVATVTAQNFMRESDFALELVFVEDGNDPSGQRPFSYVDPTGWTITVGAGKINAKPTGGFFTLADPAASQSTADIAFGALAEDVRSAISSALTTNWSTAQVTVDARGDFTITNGVNGLKTVLTAGATKLQPAQSTVNISETMVGSASLPEQVFVELVRALPIGRSSGWATLPAAGGAVVVDTAGSGTQNKVFKLSWNQFVFGGDQQLSFIGDTTTETLQPIPWDAEEDDIVAIFEKHTDVDAGGVAVRKIRTGLYYITCQAGGIALSDTPALSVVSSTLQAPPGVSGSLSGNTAGCSLLLNGDDDVAISFEVRVDKNDGAGGKVVARVDGTLFANLIRGLNGVADPIDPTPTVSQVPRFYGNLTGLTGGGSTNLDGLVTVAMPVGRVVCLVVGGVLKFYQLTAGTTAEAAPGIVRPDDYNASTNAKVWIQIL